jgi:hypothetical protein
MEEDSKSWVLEWQAVYAEELMRELIDKTKNGLVWTSLGEDKFQSTTLKEGTAYDFIVIKTPFGRVTDTYHFDVLKDGANFLKLQDGPFSHTERENAIKQLFDIVEIRALDLDSNLREALRVAQGI